MPQLDYERYLDQILGGWIGKSMDGAIGARFEGNKGWIEIPSEEMFPAVTPPNDDLDLQVLWLKVLEDAFRLYVNDALALEVDESVWWTPFNNTAKIHLKKGRNRLLLKLLKRSDLLKFTIGFRATATPHGYGGGFNWQDWIIDLADVVPVSAWILHHPFPSV